MRLPFKEIRLLRQLLKELNIQFKSIAAFRGTRIIPVPKHHVMKTFRGVEVNLQTF
jgi:hypothetical protein